MGFSASFLFAINYEIPWQVRLVERLGWIAVRARFSRNEMAEAFVKTFKRDYVFDTDLALVEGAPAELKAACTPKTAKPLLSDLGNGLLRRHLNRSTASSTTSTKVFHCAVLEDQCQSLKIVIERGWPVSPAQIQENSLIISFSQNLSQVMMLAMMS